MSTAASSPLEPVAARTSCRPAARLFLSTRRPSQRWCARGVRDAGAHSEEPGCLGASCSGGPSEPLAGRALVVTCGCGSGPSSSTRRLPPASSLASTPLRAAGRMLSARPPAAPPHRTRPDFGVGGSDVLGSTPRMSPIRRRVWVRSHSQALVQWQRFCFSLGRSAARSLASTASTCLCSGHPCSSPSMWTIGERRFTRSEGQHLNSDFWKS